MPERENGHKRIRGRLRPGLLEPESICVASLRSWHARAPASRADSPRSPRHLQPGERQAHSAWPDDEPLVIERAEGMHLFDTDGNRYLDGVSSLWLSVHGHAVPEIDAAIRDQLGRLDHATFLGLTHEPGPMAEEPVELSGY